MKNVTIRKSKLEDLFAIQQLMKLCFGDRRKSGAYRNIEDRYYLCFENNTLVAMTGIIYNDAYRGLEIDWACTHPDYRHKGYMQLLFTEMLRNVKEDVYCSCWRLPEKERINLNTIMKMFGFEEVVHERIHWKIPHTCHLNYPGGCTYCSGDMCECVEDLYLRKYR